MRTRFGFMKSSSALPKSGYDSLHALRVLHDGFAVREKSGNRERHGNAMIAKAGDPRAPK